MSASYEIALEQGSTFILSFTWNDSNGPVDLTGCNAKLRVIRNINNDDYWIVFSSLSDGTADTSVTLGGALGTIEVRAEASVTADPGFTKASYSLQVMSSDNLTVTTLLTGNFNVVPGIAW